MFALTSSKTICSRCLARRLLSTASSSTLPPQQFQSVPTRPPPPPPSGFANLTTRRLISLHGRDASRFLQGLTTANIPSPSSSPKGGFYSAFLNAQGRVLHDVFIYPAAHSQAYRDTVIGSTENAEGQADDAFLIEVDANEVDRLTSWLKRYKLRAKVTIRKLEAGEWGIWSLWNNSNSNSPPSPHQPVWGEANNLSCADTRAPGMGYRLLLPSNRSPRQTLQEQQQQQQEGAAGEEASIDQYTLRRILHGVPEGQGEILRETALPLESCIDYMGGIDFRKGCYVGQELTIRTHHTGVVRKRVLPVRLYSSSRTVGQDGHENDNSANTIPEELRYDEEEARSLVMPPLGTNISRVGTKGRSAGKFVAGVGNVGLALCRLEIMTDIVLMGEGGGWNPEQEFRIAWEGEGEGGEGAGAEVMVKAFVPAWHRGRKSV
ncbi:ccr4 associated factor [Lignoscripta atroalba]|nr:ccr4 associated factor [Lignoscripta atroalba]